MSWILQTTETYVAHVGWLAHEPGDDVGLFLRQNWFEAVEQAVLWLYLRGGDNFVDGGAHVGLFSLLAGKIVAEADGGRGVAVEPMAKTAQLLRNNISRAGLDARVIVWEGALGDKDGTAHLVVAGEGKAAYNHLKEDAQGTPVQVQTLGSLLDEMGLDRVDFLKLDIEGMELSAWRAAQMSSRRDQMGLVMVEFTEKNLNEQGHGSMELASAIEADGYVLCSFNRQTMQLEHRPVTEPIWYDNLFAVADLAAANERLAGASEMHRRIAMDLLAHEEASAGIRVAQDWQRMLEQERADHARDVDQLSAKLSEARYRADQAEERVRQLTVQLHAAEEVAAKVKILEPELALVQGRLAEMTQLAQGIQKDLADLHEKHGALVRQEQDIRERDRHARQLLRIILNSRYAKLGRSLKIFAKSPEVDAILREQE